MAVKQALIIEAAILKWAWGQPFHLPILQTWRLGPGELA